MNRPVTPPGHIMRKAPLAFVTIVAVLVQICASRGEILIDLTNQVWRYDQSGVNSEAFRERFFDDSMWPEGRSILAYESSTGLAVVQNILAHTNTVLLAPPSAPLAPNHTIDYFRTRFSFSGDGNPDTWVLTLSNLVDDAYVAYLNGVEISRYNMNPANDMLAAAAGPQPEGVYIVRQTCIPAGTLLLGENVLAVRVHQNAGTSSDVVWGTVLHASPGSAPAVFSPPGDVTMLLRQGANTNLIVDVRAAPCATHQWYKNDEPIDGATSMSFTIANMDASQAGTYFLRSVNAVGTIGSPNFVVSYVDDVQPPTVLSVVADLWDLSMVTVTFSEDVIDLLYPPGFDPLPFYIEERDNFPGDIIFPSSVRYGSSSNIAIVTLAEPRDPAIRYQLVIMTHGIEDRFGNRLYDPTIVGVTVPTVFQNGRDGYVGTQDTEVRFSAPDSAAGGQAVTVNTDGEDGVPSGAVHTLLRFEDFIGGVGGIPPVATITKATLRIYTDDQGGSPVRVMRMLSNWDEGSTWNSLIDGISETNGVESVQINTVDCSDEGTPRVFDDIDVTETVQAWLYGEPNYGFAFLPRDANGWRWVASENATVAERPALIIEYWYEPPPCMIVQQPESQTVWAGGPFALNVASFGSDLTYQWYFDPAGALANFSPITGATSANYTVPRSSPSHNGRYYVVVRSSRAPEPAFACTSQLATVTVVCEDAPLQLVSAIGDVNQTNITLAFNDSLDPGPTLSPTNYTISGGVSVSGVAVAGERVTLTTTPRSVGQNYTVTVRNLRDDGFCLNTLYPNPTIATLTQDVRLLSFDAVWRYHNEGQDLGMEWRNRGYDDAVWPAGQGLLGFETTDGTLNLLSNQNLFVRTTLTRTNFGPGKTNITDYFRTWVDVPFDTSGVSFAIRHVVDDGAVFYFNGAEAARYNMPTGEILFDTTALVAPGEGVVRSITNLTGLVSGWNSVAVEVHQQSTVSGDVLFGAELIARVSEFLLGRLAIARDADGMVTISWNPGSATLQEAHDLHGLWTDVEGAANPMRISLGAGNRFFRLRSF